MGQQSVNKDGIKLMTINNIITISYYKQRVGKNKLVASNDLIQETLRLHNHF